MTLPTQLTPPAEAKAYYQLWLRDYPKFRELCAECSMIAAIHVLAGDKFDPHGAAQIVSTCSHFLEVVRTKAEIANGNPAGTEANEIARIWEAQGPLFTGLGLEPPRAVALYPGRFKRVRTAWGNGKLVILGVDYLTCWRLNPKASGQPRSKINHYFVAGWRHLNAKGEICLWVIDSLRHDIVEYREVDLKEAAANWGAQNGYRLGNGAVKGCILQDVDTDPPPPPPPPDDPPTTTPDQLRARLRAVRSERDTLKAGFDELTTELQDANAILARYRELVGELDAVETPVGPTDATGGMK